VRSSDARARLGHISGLGSKALRWALVEAAQKACQGGGPLRQDFERIAKRRGRKIAKVAVARKILTLCYYGLRDGEIRCLKPSGRGCGRSARRQPAVCASIRRPARPQTALRSLRAEAQPPPRRRGPSRHAPTS